MQEVPILSVPCLGLHCHMVKVTGLEEPPEAIRQAAGHHTLLGSGKDGDSFQISYRNWHQP